MTIDYLLKIRRGKLFLGIIFLPILIGLIYELLSPFLFGHNLGFVNNPLVVSIYYLILILWNYAVIARLGEFTPELSEKAKRRAKIFFIYVMLYTAFLTIHILEIFNWLSDNIFLRIIFYLSLLFAIYSLFSLIYYSAKTIKLIELKSQIRLPDIIVAMFAIFYFPIGLWFMQPVVNKFYGEKINDKNIN